MTRLKLFLFYTAMAWVSALNPHDGQVMINDAERGAQARLVGDIHQNGHTDPAAPAPGGQSADLILFGTLALVSTIGWAVILVSLAVGWSE